MEYQNEYASKGVAGTALGLGAGALGVSLLNGNLGNLFGCNAKAASADDMPVTRYELNMVKELIAKDTEIAYLKGRDAAKTDSLELYKYVDGRFAAHDHEFAEQRVCNATLNSALVCLQSQVNQIAGLTKVIIPASSICPPVMPQYNSWTAPTTTTGA